MAARKKSAVAKRGSNALALPDSLRDEFSEHISRDKAASKGGSTGWDFFKTAGSTLKFDGNEWDPEHPFIILNAVRQNAYFPHAFDPQNPMGPACAALDSEGNEAGMVPLDGPNKQSDSCAECWANVFKSASNGRGKACKNSVVLCVLPAHDIAGTDFEGVAGARINVPPTSLKGWAQYSRRIVDGAERPLFSVSTFITLEPLNTGGFKMNFDFGEPLNDPDLLRQLGRRSSGDGLANAMLAPELATDSASAPSGGGAARIPSSRGKTRTASSGQRKKGARKK